MLAGKLKPPGDGEQRLADWQGGQGQGCDHPVPANKDGQGLVRANSSKARYLVPVFQRSGDSEDIFAEKLTFD